MSKENTSNSICSTYSKVNSGVHLGLLSEDELKNILITLDGLGKEIKEKALYELISKIRDRQISWQ